MQNRRAIGMKHRCCINVGCARTVRMHDLRGVQMGRARTVYMWNRPAIGMANAWTVDMWESAVTVGMICPVRMDTNEVRVTMGVSDAIDMSRGRDVGMQDLYLIHISEPTRPY